MHNSKTAKATVTDLIFHFWVLLQPGRCLLAYHSIDYICRYRQFLLFHYLLAFPCFATFETLIQLYYFFVYFCKLIMTGEPVHITSNRRMAPDIPYNILHRYVHPNYQ